MEQTEEESNNSWGAKLEKTKVTLLEILLEGYMI